LHAEGIGKGDKVIIWFENRPEWVAAFWGCVLEGVIVVPIDCRASAGLLRRVEEIVRARAILIGEEVRLPHWEHQPPVWRLSDLEWSTVSGEAPSANISKDDIAEIVFTSGATGVPKGVLIKHRNILANIVSPERIIEKYGKWFRPVFPLRFLSLIPLSHMFGQMLTLFVVPLIPGVAVFMRGYSPHEIVRQIHKRRISVVVAVPKILEVLREHILHRFPEAADPRPAARHWILRWWRYRWIHRLFGCKFWAFVVGGAPLDPELEEFWRRLGFAVIQGYGLTETAPIVAFNNPFHMQKGTVGQPIAGMEVMIAPNGEILVRGESVTSGYYEAAAATTARKK
jgi:long-chain acyl-CoA synthetase